MAFKVPVCSSSCVRKGLIVTIPLENDDASCRLGPDGPQTAPIHPFPVIVLGVAVHQCGPPHPQFQLALRSARWYRMRPMSSPRIHDNVSSCQSPTFRGDQHETSDPLKGYSGGVTIEKGSDNATTRASSATFPSRISDCWPATGGNCRYRPYLQRRNRSNHACDRTGRRASGGARRTNPESTSWRVSISRAEQREQ